MRIVKKNNGPTKKHNLSSPTKEGHDYVCVSCHRLMYRQTVVRLNRDKYKKASDTLLVRSFSMLVSIVLTTYARLVIVLCLEVVCLSSL